MFPPNLLLKRMLFGKFSYQFQHSVIESYHVKTPQQNYLRPCSKMDPLNHFRKVSLHHSTVDKYISTEQISFGDVDFGLTFKQIRKFKKKFSYYDIQKYEEIEWRRLGFKEQIFSYGVRRIYHFISDEFFYGELFFPDIRKVDHSKIARFLLEKYLGKVDYKPGSDFRIDNPGAFIFYENSGINLSIKYISKINGEINEKINKLTKASSLLVNSSKSDLEAIL